MNTNFAKLVAIGIFGGVVKALFAAPRPVTNNYYETPGEKSDTIEIGSTD